MNSLRWDKINLVEIVNNDSINHKVYGEKKHLIADNSNEALHTRDIYYDNSEIKLDFPASYEPDKDYTGGDLLEGSDDKALEAADLTAEEKALSAVFNRAIVRERKHGGLKLVKLATALDDLSRSGRTHELAQRIEYLATLPPARAPEVWDPTSGETAGEAIERIYHHWLTTDRIHQGILRTIDPPLYGEYLSKKRANPMPPLVAEKLVTRTVFNTRALEQPPEADLAFEVRQRKSKLRYSRKNLAHI